MWRDEDRRSRRTRFVAIAAVVTVLGLVLSPAAVAEDVEQELVEPVYTDDGSIRVQLTLGVDQRPTILYTTATYNGYLDTSYELLTCSNASCTTPLEHVTTGIGRDDSGLLSLTTSPISGLPVSLTWDGFHDELQLTRCTSADCSSTLQASLSGGGYFHAGNHQLAIDASDRPVIVWHDGDFIRFLRCGDALCSSGNAELELFETRSSNKSLALDSSDYPVMLRSDPEDDSLGILVRCGDATCGSVQTSAITNGYNMELTANDLPTYLSKENQSLDIVQCADVGCASTSAINIAPCLQSCSAEMVLDANDWPVVAFRELSGPLQLFRCLDATCTNPTIETIDSFEPVAFDYALSVTDVGYPVVVFSERLTTEGRSIKILHCDDLSCTRQCDGLDATINLNDASPGAPTAGDDVIFGTPGDDTIIAGGGNDRVCGSGGSDTIRGGPGDDRLFGADASDFIRGGGGDDVIDGGPGADDLQGQSGSDTISGGGGADTINGGGSADVLLGDAGPDSIQGSNGGDTINGGAGGDHLVGQTGPDVLRGEGGDDRMSGGAGADTLFGGAAVDWCAGNTGPDQAEASTCEQTPGVETLF